MSVVNSLETYTRIRGLADTDIGRKPHSADARDHAGADRVEHFAFLFIQPDPPLLFGETPPNEERFYRRDRSHSVPVRGRMPRHDPWHGTAGPIEVPERTLGEFVLSLLFSAFLHGNLLHIGGNMLFLWVFGNNVEDFLGHFKYILFYLVGAIGSGFAQVLTNLGSDTPAIGASGAVAAILGAYFVLYPRARVNVLVPIIFIWTVLQLSAFVVLGLWFLISVPTCSNRESRGRLTREASFSARSSS